MASANTWHAALRVLADHSPMTYWRMANGTEFWWSLSDRSQLLSDRFADEPFLYSEILSATVFREIRLGAEVLGCDWEAVRDKLSTIAGLKVEAVREWAVPAASSESEGLRLTMPAP